MRQRIGAKKIRRYRELTGLDVVAGSVRGNTNHRVDLFLRDGSILARYPDGSTMQLQAPTEIAPGSADEGKPDR